MSTIQERRAEVTVTQVVAGIPEDELSTRERLRIRAIMGAASVRALKDFTQDQLEKVLAGSPIAGVADPAVMACLTMPIQRKRIRVVAELLLGHLNSELGEEVVVTPTFVAPTPAPASRPKPGPRPSSQAATPAHHVPKSTPKPGPPARKEAQGAASAAQPGSPRTNQHRRPRPQPRPQPRPTDKK